MPGKPPPGKRSPSLWSITTVAGIAAMLYLAGISLADNPAEVDVGALKKDLSTPPLACHMLYMQSID